MSQQFISVIPFGDLADLSTNLILSIKTEIFTLKCLFNPTWPQAMCGHLSRNSLPRRAADLPLMPSRLAALKPTGGTRPEANVEEHPSVELLLNNQLCTTSPSERSTSDLDS